MRRTIGLTVLIGLALGAATATAQTVLFSEDWSGGTISSTRWTLKSSDPNNFVVVDPLGNGDNALAMVGTSEGGGPGPNWGDDQLYSRNPFSRQAGLYMRFKAWFRTSAGGGMHAGWHHNKIGPLYGNDLTNSPEATIGYVYSSMSFYESGDGFQIFGHDLGDPADDPDIVSAAFNAAMGATDAKANAMDVRISLGATDGAKWEWSIDGGMHWHQGRRTLGTGTSNFGSNYLGFGPYPGQGSTLVIDDIEVGVLPIDVDAAGELNVDEDRTLTASYNIKLLGTPTQNVTVTVDPDDQLEVNDAGAGNPVDLIFTPATANSPKTVTVKAIDDAAAEDPHIGLITQTTQSADGAYDGLDVGGVVVNIADNDPFCGMQGQVYSYFDFTGPDGTPDCYVNLLDFAALSQTWMLCTDLSDPGCTWIVPY